MTVAEKINIAISALAGAFVWEILCYFISLDFIAFFCSIWGIAGGAVAAVVLESRESATLRDGIVVGALSGVFAALIQTGYSATFYFGGGIDPLERLVYSSMFFVYLLLHVLFGMFGGIAAIIAMKKPY